MTRTSLTTNQALIKFGELERTIAAERGDFTLFALVRPEEGLQDQWDLVVAAPWEPDTVTLRKYLVDQIQQRLGVEMFFVVSGIVPVPADHPLTQALLSEYPVEHGRIRVEDDTFLGLPITKAYIITARSARPAVAA